MTTDSVTYIEPTAEELAEGVRLRRKKRMTNFAIDVFLIVVSILMLLPLVFLVANAFKTPAEMLAWPPTIIPRDPTIANFSAVLGETPLLRWIGNSIAFAVMSTIAIVATSAIAGYIFGKFRFRTLNILFALFLATAIVPFEVYMIPLYFQAKSLGILNSIWGLLLGYLVMSFGIFLIRQNVIHSISTNCWRPPASTAPANSGSSSTSSCRSCAARLALSPCSPSSRPGPPSPGR